MKMMLKEDLLKTKYKSWETNLTELSTNRTTFRMTVKINKSNIHSIYRVVTRITNMMTNTKTLNNNDIVSAKIMTKK